jgi:hypothetical protein
MCTGPRILYSVAIYAQYHWCHQRVTPRYIALWQGWFWWYIGKRGCSLFARTVIGRCRRAVTIAVVLPEQRSQDTCRCREDCAFSCELPCKFQNPANLTLSTLHTFPEWCALCSMLTSKEETSDFQMTRKRGQSRLTMHDSLILLITSKGERLVPV